MSRDVLHDSFVKKVPDSQWASVLKKTTDCFLFLHADNNRLSDAGYLRFVEAARKYKDNSQFYVVSIYSGDKTARQYEIPGFPTLFHIHNITTVEQFEGPYSIKALEGFISKYCEYKYSEINVSGNETMDELFLKSKTDNFDFRDVVFMFSNNETRFGRLSLELTKEFNDKVHFVRVDNKKLSEKLKIRFPSLVFYRNDDMKTFIYNGEPLLKNFVNWINEIPKGLIQRFNMKLFFENDGHPKRIVLRFIDTFEEIKEYAKLSQKYPKISFLYAKEKEANSILNLINQNKHTNDICFLSNYSRLGYVSCSEEDFEDFSNSSLNMSFIKTPKEAFGGIAYVNELGLKDLLTNGPVFSVFMMKGIPITEEFTEMAISAAVKIASSGSKVPWCIYNVHKNIPSFKDETRLSMPSIGYFKSNNLTDIIQYTQRPQTVSSIIDWAHRQVNDFDIDGIFKDDEGQYNNM